MSDTTSLPELPGFNTATALKMLNNNEKLYTSVHKRFYGQYQPKFAGLSARFANLPRGGEDLAEAQREAHTLKGLAGTIGHTLLREAAVKFDAAARDPSGHGREELQALSAALLLQLSAALAALRAAFPEA